MENVKKFEYTLDEEKGVCSLQTSALFLAVPISHATLGKFLWVTVLSVKW